MGKNILIVSSDFTGHGHKSITEALKEQFLKHDDVNIQVVDGFTLGKSILNVGKLYGSVTRNAKDLWKLCWDVSLKKPSLINDFIELTIRDNFLKLIKNFKPDLILSVHPNFNGSILNILKEYNIKVPFVTLIADLVSITPLWADPRADYIICPTQESKYKCLEFGVSEAQTKVIGFPIRSRFSQHISNEAQIRDYSTSQTLECLIMSGGEGSGNMSRVAKTLLTNFNCNVSLIAGRNNVLRRRLEHTLAENFPGRVKIHGFVQEIQELMIKSDIIFTRGSPNSMLEAVMCNTPVVVTGALPGQEQGNPEYMAKNNLGIVCKEIKRLKYTVSDLLADDAKKLNQIKHSQRAFRNAEIPAEIVEFLLSIEKNDNVVFPDIKLRMRNPFSSDKLTATRRLRRKKKV